jgi:hypothetical protein
MLQPPQQLTFNAPIWRMQFDAAQPIVYLELRDADSHTVHFAAVNSQTGQAYFNHLQLPEPWFCGIEAGHNGVLLLHGYQAAQSPVHQGITAVDAYTGHVLWTNYVHSFSQLSKQGVWVTDARIKPERLQLLNLQTGQLVPANPALATLPQPTALLLPALAQYLPAGLQNLVDFDTVGLVHYLEHNGCRIVSLHQPLPNGYRQHLLIEKQGVLYYADVLQQQVQKLQPEAFIVNENTLFYIKQGITLSVLNL